jgi:uncharacterized protein (TIGR03435 family)
MKTDERALKELMGRRSPSHLEFVSARDRVIRELRNTPAERLIPRIGTTVTAPRWSRRLALAAVLVLSVTVWSGIVWPSLAFTRIPIFESFMRGMSQTAGRLSPFGAQNADTGPQFEEASIRECDPDNLDPLPAGARGGGPNSFYMTPGRTYALCMTPAVLIRVAYGFRALPEGSLTSDTRRPQAFRVNQLSGQGANAGIAIRGGPDWARSDRYTVEAVAGYEADGETMSGPMLRALLERRFKLKAHVETEEVPAWTLTVAPGGLKIRPMAAPGCDEPAPVPPGQQMLRRTAAEVRGGAKPTCGVWAEQDAERGTLVWVVGGGTIDDLAAPLRRQLNGAGLANRTGLTGRFNVILDFGPEDQASLVSALERELGLRLEPTRAVREYLVIDSIERPGAN